MDIVLLLGAGAEPAQSIARRLVANGARVYGLANKFPDQGFSHRDFVPVGVNPADPSAVRAEVEKIVAKEGAVGAVILAGHNPVEDAFESAHPNDVALAIFAGLAAPLAAVRAAMPGLIRRRGLVLAITRPVFGPGAALGGVVEAGLASFCDGLFGELRDTGVRVSHIRLQENAGPADPAARFNNAPQSRVQPEIVADTVEAIMNLRENNAITRLVLRPQATREEPRLPVTAEPRLASLQVVQLPTSRNYPPAEDKIRTPDYRRPDYAPPPEDRDEEEDDEDDAVDPELAYLIKPRHRDRFVRDAAPAPMREQRRPDAFVPQEAPSENSGDEENSGKEISRDNPGVESRQPVREPRRDATQAPQHRQEPRQEQNRYHNPYAPQQPIHRRNDDRGPRHGSLRIQSPVTTEGVPQAPQPSQQALRDQELRRQQEESRRNDGRQGERRIEQMPRPQGWQGPRCPQHIAVPPRSAQEQRQPQQQQPKAAPAQPAAAAPASASASASAPVVVPAVVSPTPKAAVVAATYAENDLFHTLRNRQQVQHPEERRDERRDTAREGRARARDDGHRPRIITDERGHAVGSDKLGKGPASDESRDDNAVEPAKPVVARPAPVIVPVEKSDEPADKKTTGRSEAVTLNFAKKTAPAAKAPVAAEPEPVEEVAAKPAKAAKKVPAKKAEAATAEAPVAKTTKAAKAAKAEVAPEAEAPEPAKPAKKAPAKKAAPKK